jgi:hypothetical protein
MYKDQATGTLFNKILGFSNCNLINLGGSMKPMEDVTVKLDWYDLSLVQPYSDAAALIAGRHLSGIPSDTTYTMRARKHHLADEIDLGVTYDYTEDVQLGLCGAMFVPGAAFDKTNHENATQVIGSMKVTF